MKKELNGSSGVTLGRVGGIREVVDGGYCIGCGACASVVPEIKIIFNRFGDLVAKLPPQITNADIEIASKVCPFADGTDETAWAARLFPQPEVLRHEEVGSYIATFAAYAHSTREDGSSGGIASWVLTTLLEKNLIDYAIHVGPRADDSSERFFEYRLSASSAEVRAGSTSFYYPISLDEVLATVRSRPGRYAVTGVPCFHKALRRLRENDPVLDERIAFQIGIVCGQMKSAHYLEYLTRTAGGEGVLRSACFRKKVPNARADDYAFEAITESKSGGTTSHLVRNGEIGVNWGMGFFKPRACDFCDDVMAETADIAVMDAWLPKYVSDGLGWSLVVTRTMQIDRLFSVAHRSGEVVLEPVEVSDVATSQRGGLNHRRLMLPYRLWLNRHRWTPIKRCRPSQHFPLLLRMDQRLRERLRARSREVWLAVREKADLVLFRRRMSIDVTLFRLISRAKRKLGLS